MKGPASGTYDWKDADAKSAQIYVSDPCERNGFDCGLDDLHRGIFKPSRSIEAKMKQIEARFLMNTEGSLSFSIW